jgi:hypothetical protein
MQSCSIIKSVRSSYRAIDYQRVVIGVYVDSAHGFERLSTPNFSYPNG